MQPTRVPTHNLSPLVRFVGDIETGIVHHVASSCQVDAELVFLDLRTAVVRGFHPCPLCQGT